MTLVGRNGKAVRVRNSMSVKRLQSVQAADFKTKEISRKKSEAPPYSNTGVLEEKIGVDLGVRPDYLKLSFQFADFVQDIDILWDKLNRRLRKRTLKGRSFDGWTWSFREKGQNGFKYGRYLEVNRQVRGAIFWGGASQRGWVMLELRGALCALLRRQDWISLWRLGCRFEGRLGQIDIAVDDLTGDVFNVSKIDRDFRKNRARFKPPYRTQGKVPAREMIVSDTGATLYIGSRDSAVKFRIYEKGKQLAETVKGKKNPNWVRWEMVLRRTKLDLRMDLIHPDEWVKALMGECRYFQEKFGSRGVRSSIPQKNPIREPVEAAAIFMHNVHKNYGPGLGSLRGLMGDTPLLDVLVRGDYHPLFSYLTSYDIPALKEDIEILRDGGPASGSGALVSTESDVLEW